MAEMLIQSESLTALADEIRVLSGTTEPMGLDAMESYVGEANDEVSEQADLIAQIASALEGKAGGSGSSSGISIETCTVTFVNTSENDYDIMGTWLDTTSSGTYISNYEAVVWCEDTTEKVALKGSYLAINKSAFKSASGSYQNMGYASGAYCITINGDCTITLQ